MIKKALFMYIFMVQLQCVVFATTWIVSARQSTLQSIINKAQAHDTVLVEKGIYAEHNILVDKPLVIKGLRRPTIDAENKKAEIFIITSDHVHISGFILKNIGVSFLHEYAAIKIKQSHHGSVKNNIIEDTFFGIYLQYASHFVLSGNVIRGDASDEASAGNAIHAWKASNLKVLDNKATDHRDGIYFEFVEDSYIANNHSQDNLRYGLHFMFSHRNTYEQNAFIDNGAGVAVMFSKQITMKKNRFLKNWGGASYGLLLKEISDGSISENVFSKNTIGILAEGANRLKIKGNQFTNNGTAIDMKGNSIDNQIKQNNFLANTFEVVTNTRHNRNVYDANYWSKYSGYDLNRDGTGDVPYRPVNIYEKVTNEVPAATILLHSFLVQLLDMSERMFPEMIPEDLVDENPKMKPYKL